MLPRYPLFRPALPPALIIALLALLSTRASTSLATGSADYTRPWAVSAHTREPKNADGKIDLGRLLLKQMRFRDLSHTAQDSVRASHPHFGNWLGYHPWRLEPATAKMGETKLIGRAYNKVLKRENDRMIVDNLAALISNMKGRDTSSQLRMPSLRFG